MTLREITVGDVPVRALRVTYVGELGWELYCPTEYGLGLWRALWEAGAPHGLVAGGYRAIDSLRLEKGYRVWGADITPDETPYEGGVGFCVKLDKDGRLHRARGARRGRGDGRGRLCCLTLDDPRSVALGNEPVRVGRRDRRPRHERRLRLHASSARSPTPTCRPSTPAPGTEVEVEIFGRWVGGEVASEPLFDPQGRAGPRLAARVTPASGRRGCARCPRCARASASPRGRCRRLRSRLDQAPVLVVRAA